MLPTEPLSLVWLDTVISTKSHSFVENEGIFLSIFSWQVTILDERISGKAKSESLTECLIAFWSVRQLILLLAVKCFHNVKWNTLILF